MKSQFTKGRLKKFLSYYKPHRRIFIMDMFFAGLSSLTVVLFPLVSGIRTVKAFGQEKTYAARFAKKSKKYADSMCRFYKVEAYFYETVESYLQFLTMLVVIFGSLFITRGKMNTAVLITFLLYAGCISEPIGTMLNFVKLYESGKASFIRFMNMMDLKPEITDSENAKTLQNPRGEITFDHVDFRYKDMTENVLEDVVFDIPAGISAAFAGASGIGKTTVASLIARFYDATGGRVLIDGTDIRDIKLESLRKVVGIVQQEVYIFHGTVMANIRSGRPDAPDEEVREARGYRRFYLLARKGV